jgi:PII-like signaling protein
VGHLVSRQIGWERLLQLGRHVPAVTVVIDTPERIGTAYSVIDELTAKQGLVTSESVTAIRSASAAVRGEED